MSGSTSNQDPSILLSIVESKFDMDDSDALPDQGSGEDNPMDLLRCALFFFFFFFFFFFGR